MLIAGTNHLTSADASSSQQRAPDARPVVASACAIELGSTAELAGRNHQRRVKQPAGSKVVEQCREGPVESWQKVPRVIVERAERSCRGSPR